MAGTLVSDSLALALNDGGASTTSEAGSAGWVAAEWPDGVAQAEVALGTCTGTSVIAFIEIQSADDNTGTNKRVVGVVGPITEASDDVTYRVPIYANDPYVRCYVNIATGTSPSITPTVTLREKHYQRTVSTTGGIAS